MNTNTIINAVTKTYHKSAFAVKKHVPDILMGVGVVGIVTSTVMACKATTKVGDVVSNVKEEIGNVKIAAVAAGIAEVPSEMTEEEIVLVEALKEREEIKTYTQKDYRKDLFFAYAQSAGEFIKLYGPSFVIGTLSIGAMLTSHGVMRKRNAALAAAYATIDKGFKEYRSRVIERFGKEMDTELRHNIKAKKFKEIVKDEETGEEKKVKTTVNIADPNAYSVYARCFDETCTGWTKDAELNLTFLKQQQDWANERLKSRGYLFLNEVYDSIGIPRTKAGQIVGWIYDEKNPIGDNYIDFGIYNINSERARAFVNGYERSIWLDFNVDGNILDNL